MVGGSGVVPDAPRKGQVTRRASHIAEEGRAGLAIAMGFHAGVRGGARVCPVFVGTTCSWWRRRSKPSVQDVLCEWRFAGLELGKCEGRFCETVLCRVFFLSR